MKSFVSKIGLEIVDAFDYGQSTLTHFTPEKLLEMADTTNLEGLVFRPLTELYDPKLGRVSFKVISNKYLLGEK